MQQRRSIAAGRPSGTDGSDYSYRMVVDSRYTKVANGKSRLRSVLAVQAACLFFGSLIMLLSASQDKKLDSLAVGSISIGFVSVLIGELGRRNSQVNLLRCYIIISSIASALSVAFIVRNDVLFKVIGYLAISGITNHNLLKAGWMLFGILLQIFVIFTTMTLVYNMSPKRAS